MGQVACACQDCMSVFYGEGSQPYTDDHVLYHHPRCNHITEKVLDKIEFEDEVYIAEYDIYVMENVVHWQGYRCTCEDEYKQDEEE